MAEKINCPKGHGEMHVYDEGFFRVGYLCTDKSCNVRLELDTKTGKVVQVGGLITAVTAIGAFLWGVFGGGDNDNNAA